MGHTFYMCVQNPFKCNKKLFIVNNNLNLEGDKKLEDKKHLVLGLDCGAASVGACMTSFNLDSNGKRTFDEILKMKVVLFDSGLGHEEKTKNEKRRGYRGTRKLRNKKVNRKKKLFETCRQKLFFENSNIFEDGLKLCLVRDKVIERIDDDVLKCCFDKFVSVKGRTEHTVYNSLIYCLRALALYEQIPLSYLFRIWYNMAEHRGFQSIAKDELINNSKTEKEEKQETKFKTAIKNLESEIKNSGCKTLGEYYSFLNTADVVDDLIIGNDDYKTNRNMYIEEFDMIWDVQKGYYGKILTDKLKKRIKDLLFKQDKLQSQEENIGVCTFEPNEKRVIKSDINFAKFQILQTLNNLHYVDDEGEIIKLRTEKLQCEEKSQRDFLYEKLMECEKLEFSKIRKILGLNKNIKFNYEYEGNKEIKGYRLFSEIKKILEDERWGELSNKKKEELVSVLIKGRDAFYPYEYNILKKKIMKVINCPIEKAEKIAAISIPSEYSQLSLKAIEKLLPHLENGKMYSECVDIEYKDHLKISDSDIYTRIPPISEHPVESIRSLKNPNVIRTLSQTRKVVNELLDEFGYIDEIVVELAREVTNRKIKDEYNEKRKKNEKENKEASNFLRENGFYDSKNNRIKYRLWNETDKNFLFIDPDDPDNTIISSNRLFGSNSDIEIEHIIPKCKGGSNGLENKTLCSRSINRQKGDRTPYQFYTQCYSKDVFKKVKAHIKNLIPEEHKNNPNHKFNKFLMDDKKLNEYLDKRKDVYLNNTSYIAVLMKDFLGVLYGSKADKKIKSIKGVVVGNFRREARLNDLYEEILQKDFNNLLDLRSEDFFDNKGEYVVINGKKVRRRYKDLTEDDTRDLFQKYLKDIRKKYGPKMFGQVHALDAFLVSYITPKLIKDITKHNEEKIKSGDVKKINSITPFDNVRCILVDALENCEVKNVRKNTLNSTLHNDTIYTKIKEKNKDGEYVSAVRKPLNAIENVNTIVDEDKRNRIKKQRELFSKNLVDSKDPIIKSKKNVHLEHKIKSAKKKHRVSNLLEIPRIDKFTGEKYKHYVENADVYCADVYEKIHKGKTILELKFLTLLEANERKRKMMKKDYSFDDENQKYGKHITTLKKGDVIEWTNKRNNEILKLKVVSFDRSCNSIQFKCLNYIGDCDKKTGAGLFFFVGGTINELRKKGLI